MTPTTSLPALHSVPVSEESCFQALPAHPAATDGQHCCTAGPSHSASGHASHDQLQCHPGCRLGRLAKPWRTSSQGSTSGRKATPEQLHSHQPEPSPRLAEPSRKYMAGDNSLLLEGTSQLWHTMYCEPQACSVMHKVTETRCSAAGNKVPADTLAARYLTQTLFSSSGGWGTTTLTHHTVT